MNNLAHITNDSGDSAMAVPLFEKALQVVVDCKGECSADAVNSMQNLSLVLHGMEEYDDAEPVLLRVLKTQEDLLGDKHVGLVQTLEVLGMQYMYQRRFEDSDLMFKRALAIVQHTHGLFHRDIPPRYDNLGELYFRRGKEYWKEAEDLFRSSLSVLETVYNDQVEKIRSGQQDSAEDREMSLLLPRSIDVEPGEGGALVPEEAELEQRRALHRTHNNIAFITAMRQRAREDEREMVAKEQAAKGKKGRRGKISKKERKQVVPGDASPSPRPRPVRSAYE